MKKTFPGSADSGKVPAKIFTIAVGPFYNRRRDRMGPTATIIENRHDSGWELPKFFFVCIKKSAKRTVYTVVIFELFALSCWRIFYYITFRYSIESGEQCHVATPFLEGHLSVYDYRNDLVIFFPLNQLLKNCCGSLTFWYGFESGVQCLFFLVWFVCDVATVGSRPTNKTNREKDTNILVLLFNRSCFVFSMLLPLHLPPL